MQRSQHPSNNDVLGAPAGSTIEECMALPITRLTYKENIPAVMSFWKPTAIELNLLNQGKPVYLICLGSTMPPVKLGVEGCGNEEPY